MTIGANYVQPVIVNGYACWNCHQVSEAKQGTNPATQGPFAVQTPGASGAGTSGASPGQVGAQAGATWAARNGSGARLNILV